ncbi:Alpha/Beta hydrolase protein [Mucidula mucida]|nr:Alpha/Beta hydrolase protein [Mucidula mucida]KAF8912684.1 Alpha/Beta hydrolase protein [Mucidula mucida]
MPRESYPYVEPKLPRAAEYNYPPLLELKPPPLPATLPALPFPQRSPPWLSDEWHHSTHIVPAAYPRIGPAFDLPQPLPFDATATKAERRKVLVEVEARFRELRETEKRAKKGQRTDLLWICLNRYVRRRRDREGVTLFLAHANGFNKETWEPMIRSLLARRHNISEIWVWEAVQHGDSALLNKGKLNSMFHWHEAVRDLLHFLVHYLPSEITDELPIYVPRIPCRQYQARYCQGFKSRKLVMVGHSFGGGVSTLAAIYHPALFSSLILVDPVILYPKPPYATRDGNSNTLAVGALGRRWVWRSKDEARSQLLQSPFFQRWHPDVLTAYIEHGMYETADGNIALKMSPVHETVLFSDTWTGGEEAWVRMHRGELDESIEIRWIFPGRGEVELGAPGQTQLRAWLRKANSSNVLIDGSTHLITHEKPDALAEEIAMFVHRKYDNKGKL